MAIYHEDIVDIDLNTGTIYRNFKNRAIGKADNLANRFGVKVFREKEPVDLTGISCQGMFRDGNGNNILISSGTVTGNTAYVTLPQACYNYEGQFVLAIKLIGGGVTGTMRIIDGVVDNTNTDGAVAPTGAVPTYQEVLALYDDVLDLADQAVLNQDMPGFDSCDDVDSNSIYFISSTGGVLDVTDFPLGQPGWLLTYKNGSLKLQIAYPYNPNWSTVYIRTKQIGTWTSWKKIGADGAADYITTRTAIIQSCDSAPDNSIIFASSIDGAIVPSDFPLGQPGWLMSVTVGTVKFQIAIPFGNISSQIMTRKYSGGSWSSWTGMGVSIYTPSETIESCDDMENGTIIFVTQDQGVTNPPDFPLNAPGWLETIAPDARHGCQIAYPWNTTDEIKYRSKKFGEWSAWRNVGGGGGQTITITQEVSRDTYNNSYSGSVSPTITTDTNGWLQPVDTESADETGKTDMTSAIMAMLTSTGYCHLAPGIFYVSGNIDMPAGSMIEGCGKQTIIRLLQSVQSGYIVRMHTKSTLKNVCLSGGYSALDVSSSSIGGRRGINYIGNRDGQSTGVTPATCTLCQIEGCWFENLDSGFYGYNAGGGLQEGVEMVNCYFSRCKAGINIDYWTEYCKFTNCVTFQCHFGCINNGGNNVFMACTFHGVIGFIIDNSSGDKQNEAHGSVIGCTFNHIDNMNPLTPLGGGYGVKVIDTEAGFIFANCQFWYSKIYVESSKGVQFSDCELGGSPAIETSGNDTVFFHGCVFQSAPSVNAYSPTKFDDCYTYAGNAVTN